MADTKTRALLSPLPPTEAERAAWNALTRDEQIAQYRGLFDHPDCNTFTKDTPDDILKAAEERVTAHHRGRFSI
jgi:hypothetical protein